MACIGILFVLQQLVDSEKAMLSLFSCTLAYQQQPSLLLQHCYQSVRALADKCFITMAMEMMSITSLGKAVQIGQSRFDEIFQGIAQKWSLW